MEIFRKKLTSVDFDRGLELPPRSNLEPLQHVQGTIELPTIVESAAGDRLPDPVKIHCSTRRGSLRFAGKGLVVVREGISTPNAPYLREIRLEPQEQCSGRLLGQKSLAARPPPRHHHWRRVGSRAADEGQKPVDRERLLLPCLPPPAVRVIVACNKDKNTQQAVDLLLLSIFDFTAGQFVVDFVFSSTFGWPAVVGGAGGGRLKEEIGGCLLLWSGLFVDPEREKGVVASCCGGRRCCGGRWVACCPVAEGREEEEDRPTVEGNEGAGSVAAGEGERKKKNQTGGFGEGLFGWCRLLRGSRKFKPAGGCSVWLRLKEKKKFKPEGKGPWARRSNGWRFKKIQTGGAAPLGRMRQRFAGKGLVVVREGISTPNAPYLRNSARKQCWEASGAENQWRRVFPRATATGGAWVHAPPRKNPGTWRLRTGFFSCVF
ncbi:hypothetical protein NC652_007927 [Populus alba x Populus x berolinensis]|nr:hypothetical protein NC652_007927 [Populus alba x Populus x berolinensis]